MGCKIVNVTSGYTLRSHACGEGSACDLGPLTVTHCDGTPIQITFCSGQPHSNGSPRRKLYEVACSLQSSDGSISVTDTCPGKDANCTLGPLTLTVNNTQVQARFCERPVPTEGCKGLPGQRHVENRRKMISGRGVCMVVDAEGNDRTTKHNCPSDVGCTVGPLVRQTPRGEMEAWFCAGEQDKLAERACNVTYGNGTVTNPRDCRKGECSLGPLEITLEGESAMASFCFYAAKDDLVGNSFLYMYINLNVHNT